MNSLPRTTKNRPWKTKVDGFKNTKYRGVSMDSWQTSWKVDVPNQISIYSSCVSNAFALRDELRKGNNLKFECFLCRGGTSCTTSVQPVCYKESMWFLEMYHFGAFSREKKLLIDNDDMFKVMNEHNTESQIQFIFHNKFTVMFIFTNK